MNWTNNQRSQVSPGAGEIVQATSAREDEDADLGVAENGQFLSLLEQPRPSLGEGDLSASHVLNLLHDGLPPNHGAGGK